MWRILLAPVLAISVPALGEMFGDVRVGEKYLVDVPLELTCGLEVVKAKTDSTGSFRLAAKATGRCRLAVTHEGQSPAVDIVLFDKPARYRLVLEKKDAAWILRRV